MSRPWPSDQEDDTGYIDNLKELGIDLEFVRDDKKNTHQIKAQSKVENRETGFLSADDKKKLRDQLREGIEKLKDETLDIKGSPSIRELHGLKLTHIILKEFAKKQNIVTSKNVKPKLERRSSKLSAKKTETKVISGAVALSLIHI